MSFLDENGAPGVVERATILPPQSSMKGIDLATRQAIMDGSPFRGVYDEVVDRESAYELLAASFQREQAPAPVQAFRPVPAAQVQVTSAQPTVNQPQGFKVYDPATGQYVQRDIPTMSPLPQQPVIQQPVVQQPAAAQQMPVMMYDPATGQYVQRMMTMQLDPATGNYVAVQPQNAAPANPQAAREAEKQRIAAEKAEKERKAEERRQRADELREERAERARRNDSVLGRVKNTAISTASREVTRQLTRGIMGGISGLFGGKK